MSDEEKKKREQEEFDKLFDDLFKQDNKKTKSEKKSGDDILDDDFLQSLFEDDNKHNQAKDSEQNLKEAKLQEQKKDEENFDWLKDLIDEIDKEEQEKKKETSTAVAPVNPPKPVKPSFTSKLKDKPRAPKPPEHIRMWGSGKKIVHIPNRDETNQTKSTIYSKFKNIIVGSFAIALSIASGFFTSEYLNRDIKRDICKTANVILKTAYTGDKILIDTSVVSENGKRIIEQGYIDAHISNLMYNLVKPGESVIDVGAGFGYHTLYLARIVGNGGKVYSFEARKCVYDLLDSSIRINTFTNVEVFHSVLFSENMRIIVDSNDYSKRSSFGVNNIILQQNNIYTDTQGEIVNATTLDTVLQNVNNVSLININANSNELNIILGAKNIIATSPNLKIITTWSKYDMSRYINVQMIVQQLMSNGFRFWLIKPSSGKLVELTRVEHIMQVERGRFLIAKSIN